MGFILVVGGVRGEGGGEVSTAPVGCLRFLENKIR